MEKTPVGATRLLKLTTPVHSMGSGRPLLKLAPQTLMSERVLGKLLK